MKLTEVEGIGDVYAEKLQAVGIETTEQFLDKGATPQGRAALAESTDISTKLLLRWLNHVDLFRVKGVKGEYADLLEAAGVDTVPELAQRNPDNLWEKLSETNAEKHLVRRLPGKEQVAQWIEAAKALPRVLTY